MNPLIVGSVLEVGKALLDRFGPEDKAKKRAMEAEFLRMAADGELRQVVAQLEVNAREAQHPSIFVSGGRPLFLWIGGAGFAYATLLQPLLTWLARIQGWPEPPSADIELLWVVVTGLLGIGTMRSYDKARGTSK